MFDLHTILHFFSDQDDQALTDDQLVTSWLYGKAVQTQRGYKARFVEWRHYLRKRHVELRNIKLHHAQAYLTSLERKQIMSRPVAAILKSFYRFATTTGHIQRNPLDSLRLGKQPPPKVARKLTKGQIRKILAMSKTFKKKGSMHYMCEYVYCVFSTVCERIFLTFTNLIDRLVCSLAVFSGLRRAELAALQTDDITKHHDKSVSVFVRNGKGSKQRSVVLPSKFGRELHAFALARGSQVSLFEATPQTIANRWRAVCNAAGLPACSTHWSRHAYTTLSLSGLKDGSRPSLIAVSRSLGHASVEQTGT